MPKICSQGYHFSPGWLFFFLLPPPKSGDQRGFISVTHQTKTMSRGEKKQWCRTVEGRTWPHPAVLRPPPDGRVTLQVWERLLPPVSTLTARPESRVLAAPLSLCQCHVSGSFGPVQGRRVPERSHRDNNRSGQLLSVCGKRLRTISLCTDVLLLNGAAELTSSWRAVCPEARANGLLTPRQALGLQVVLHCGAALINSYKSWRDKCWTAADVPNSHSPANPPRARSWELHRRDSTL